MYSIRRGETILTPQRNDLKSQIQAGVYKHFIKYQTALKFIASVKSRQLTQINMIARISK